MVAGSYAPGPHQPSRNNFSFVSVSPPGLLGISFGVGRDSLQIEQVGNPQPSRERDNVVSSSLINGSEGGLSLLQQELVGEEKPL